MVREFHRAKAPHHKKLVFDTSSISCLVRELREFHRANAPHHKKLVFDTCHIVHGERVPNRAKAPHYEKLVFVTCHIVHENSTEQRRPTTRNWCLILVISYREFRRAKAPHHQNLVFDSCHIVQGQSSTEQRRATTRNWCLILVISYMVREFQRKGAPPRETGVCYLSYRICERVERVPQSIGAPPRETGVLLLVISYMVKFHRAKASHHKKLVFNTCHIGEGVPQSKGAPPQETGVCYLSYRTWVRVPQSKGAPAQETGVCYLSYRTWVSEFHRAKAPHHKKLVFDTCHIVLVIVHFGERVPQSTGAHHKKLVFSIPAQYRTWSESSTEERRPTTRNWCLLLVISYMVREFHRAKAPHHAKLVFKTCLIVLSEKVLQNKGAFLIKKLVFDTCHIVHGEGSSTETRRPTTRNSCLLLVISDMVREFHRAKAPHYKKLVFDTCHIVHGERVPQSTGAPPQETGV
ncbi:hypothetical protein RRG08_021208 [Elysia crispata]|uniref:Uncharacterized protein n=1 Tax=Elysia crispata TaxID=231223 RepID=A0AAE0YAC3_9GAST|nr:hypothetical protein RRG08_021208 [Elysia crispata]